MKHLGIVVACLMIMAAGTALAARPLTPSGPPTAMERVGQRDVCQYGFVDDPSASVDTLGRGHEVQIICSGPMCIDQISFYVESFWDVGRTGIYIMDNDIMVYEGVYRVEYEGLHEVPLDYPVEISGTAIIMLCAGQALFCTIGEDRTNGPFTNTYRSNGECYPTTQITDGNLMLWANICAPLTGACCFPDGACTVEIQTACMGAWQGPNTNCSPTPCPQPPTGRCCLPDGSCTVTTQANCTGMWTVGINCSAIPGCPIPNFGACCLPNGDCALVDGFACEEHLGGAYEGDGTHCTPNPCPQPPTDGACCNTATGACTITVPTACEYVFLGLGSLCDAETCPVPPTGRCCDPMTGDCAITTQADCAGDWDGTILDCSTFPTCPIPQGGACCFSDGSCVFEPTPMLCVRHGGLWMGDGVLCQPNPCEQPPTEGACCNTATGACTITVPTACEYEFLGLGSLCDAQTCPVPPPTGRCCDPMTGDCTITTQTGCAGNWDGTIHDCTTFPVCPVLIDGACCFPDGTCLFVNDVFCDMNSGQFMGQQVPCEPNPCEQPPTEGACCDTQTGNCAITVPTACEYEFLGVGSLCDAQTCPVPPPPAEGACCDHTTGNCTVTTEAACAFDWLGADVPCDAATCVPPVPTERTSWGQIKNTYR